MDRRDEDSGAIAWPGFVDILSAVIIIFIFFVMITSIIMFFLSIEFKKNLKKQNDEQVEKMVSKEMAHIIEQFNAGEITIEQIKDNVKQQEHVETLENENEKLTRDKLELAHEIENLSGAIDQIKADFANAEDQDIELVDNYLTILFKYNDISLSDETTEALNKYIETRIINKNIKKYSIKIVASDNPNSPTISTARQISLSRILNIRNVFLNHGVSTKSFSVKFIQPQDINGSYNWIKIGVQKK